MDKAEDDWCRLDASSQLSSGDAGGSESEPIGACFVGGPDPCSGLATSTVRHEHRADRARDAT